MRSIIPLALALLLQACSVYSPDAGHEVVLIEKPWVFGHGGVDADPVKPGRTFTAVTTDGIDVYMQPQKFDTEMHDTMTSDGVPISFHAIADTQQRFRLNIHVSMLMPACGQRHHPHIYSPANNIKRNRFTHFTDSRIFDGLHAPDGDPSNQRTAPEQAASSCTA